MFSLLRKEQHLHQHKKKRDNEIPRPKQTFTLFPQLPIEIRLQIINIAISEPRHVNVKLSQKAKKAIRFGYLVQGIIKEEALKNIFCPYRSRQPVPAVLQVCSGWRAEALKHYEVFRSSRSSDPLPLGYFNFNVDMLHWGVRDMADMALIKAGIGSTRESRVDCVDWNLLMRAMLEDDMKRIRFLAPERGAWRRRGWLKENVFAKLRGLEHLILLVEPGPYGSYAAASDSARVGVHKFFENQISEMQAEDGTWKAPTWELKPLQEGHMKPLYSFRKVVKDQLYYLQQLVSPYKNS
jgi:hypothetical protein